MVSLGLAWKPIQIQKHYRKPYKTAETHRKVCKNYRKLKKTMEQKQNYRKNNNKYHDKNEGLGHLLILALYFL